MNYTFHRIGMVFRQNPLVVAIGIVILGMFFLARCSQQNSGVERIQPTATAIIATTATELLVTLTPQGGLPHVRQLTATETPIPMVPPVYLTQGIVETSLLEGIEYESLYQFVTTPDEADNLMKSHLPIDKAGEYEIIRYYAKRYAVHLYKKPYTDTRAVVENIFKLHGLENINEFTIDWIEK